MCSLALEVMLAYYCLSSCAGRANGSNMLECFHPYFTLFLLCFGFLEGKKEKKKKKSKTPPSKLLNPKVDSHSLL